MCATLSPLRLLVVVAAARSAAAYDYNAFLEREVLNKVTPFMASGNGRFYFGGTSIAGGDNSPVWPNNQNETLGFMHPFLRDGRARGMAITCDSITGCGHSLWNWDFYREARVLKGSVTVDNSTVDGPAPMSLKWRPDKITAVYDTLGAIIVEQKFFTSEGVLVSILNLTGYSTDQAASPLLNFSGHSFVNTQLVRRSDPSSRGLPKGAEYSIARNSKVAHVDDFGPCGDAASPSTTCGAIAVSERGTAYAKPLDCTYEPQPPGFNCLAKVGRLMYDNTTVVVGASVPIAPTLTMGADKARRQWYNFSITLALGQPVVLAWAHGDDPELTKSQVSKLLTVDAALTAMEARGKEINDFMSTAVPYVNVTQRDATRMQHAARALDVPRQLTQREEEVDATETGGIVAIPSVNAGNVTPNVTWDVHRDTACDGTAYKHVNDVDTEEACETLCNVDLPCVMFEWNGRMAGGNWCELYNVSTPPQKNIGYDCGCEDACPPPPGPPRPPSPPPPAIPYGINDAYWFGWANWFFLSLNSGLDGTFETVRHVQSAPNNFLGLHLHDSQYYIGVGGWVRPDLHPEWAHGNVIMWSRAYHSKMLNYSAYWKELLSGNSGPSQMPDNMGSTWVSSAPTPELAYHVDPVWSLFQRGGNTTFLALAYDLFRSVLAPLDGNITDMRKGKQRTAWSASGKYIAAPALLALMAEALGNNDDAAAWRYVQAASAKAFSQQWGICGTRWGCTDDIISFSSMWALEPLYKDEWAHATAEEWLLNDEYGYSSPNRTYGATPNASPLNHTRDGPWLSHTTGAVEAMEGMFRHNDDANAVKLTVAHLDAMQRDYGWTVYPEAWDRRGGLWGDQWYLWGVPIAIRLVLERLAGVDMNRVQTAPNASSVGILTVHDAVPEDWEAAHIRIPEPNGVWVDIHMTMNATFKQITVANNTAGALKLEPWLNGSTLVSASPPGYTIVKGHVCWTFVGTDAAYAQVQIVMTPAPPEKPREIVEEDGELMAMPVDGRF